MDDIYWKLRFYLSLAVGLVLGWLRFRLKRLVEVRAQILSQHLVSEGGRQACI